MTQALLNNLTNQVNQFEKTVDFASKKSDTKMDFQNLFLQKSQQDNAKKTLNKEEQNVEQNVDVKNTIHQDERHSNNVSHLENSQTKEDETVATSKEDIQILDSNQDKTIENKSSEDEIISNDSPQEENVYDSISNVILNIMPIESEEFDVLQNIDTNDIAANIENSGNQEESNTLVNEDDVNTIILNTVNNEILLSEQNISQQTSLQNKKDEVEVDVETEVKVELDLNISQSTKTVLDENIEILNNSTVLENENSETILQLVKTEETTEAETKNLSDLVDEETLMELNIEDVNSEMASGEDSADLMKHQTAEEQGVKAMLHAEFDVPDLNIEQKPSNVTEISHSKPSLEANPSKIIEQISKQLESLQNNSKVNIILNPESLGKVVIQLVNTKDGLSAQLTCATQEARNILMKGLDGLKETLISQGINVDNVTIKQTEGQETRYQSDWTEQEGSRGGNKQQREQHSKQAKREFEQAMFNIENEENGNV